MSQEPLILIVGLLGTLCAIGRFGFGYEELPLVASIVGPLLIVGWYHFSNKRKNARRLFEEGS